MANKYLSHKKRVDNSKSFQKYLDKKRRESKKLTERFTNGEIKYQAMMHEQNKLFEQIKTKHAQLYPVVTNLTNKG